MQNKLGLNNISGLLRNEIWGIFETKNPTKEQKRKYIRTEKARSKKYDDSKFKYTRSEYL